MKQQQVSEALYNAVKRGLTIHLCQEHLLTPEQVTQACQLLQIPLTGGEGAAAR